MRIISLPTSFPGLLTSYLEPMFITCQILSECSAVLFALEKHESISERFYFAYSYNMKHNMRFAENSSERRLGSDGASLRRWRDFARECFCFGSEAVNTSSEAVRGLVKSRVPSRASPGREYGGSAARPLTRSRIPPAMQAMTGQEGLSTPTYPLNLRVSQSQRRIYPHRVPTQVFSQFYSN